MDALSMTPADVEVHGLARFFGSGAGRVVAIEPTTFAITARERIALLGPSGSGKSTLLNLMAGLDIPSAGVIAWPGIGPREALRPLAVGMIHQFAALIPTLTVAENVSLPLVLAHRPNEDAVREALAAVGLHDFAERLPDELSGGEAQRVGIARVLAHRPRLVLADEPTGQLDEATGQTLMSVILAHVERNASTLIVATHDAAVARRMEIIWHINHGRLLDRTRGAAT
jgi:putative ABC transport system ATP-binding protein/lipoprotein-releasing system ATP-binding protein